MCSVLAGIYTFKGYVKSPLTINKVQNSARGGHSSVCAGPGYAALCKWENNNISAGSPLLNLSIHSCDQKLAWKFTWESRQQKYLICNCDLASGFGWPTSLLART